MILPEEIDNQQFEVSFRGYNTREVDEFLNKIRLDIEEMAKEQEILRKKVAAAELIAKDAKTGKLKLSRKVLLPKPEGWVEREPRERKPREQRDGEKREQRGPRRERH